MRNLILPIAMITMHATETNARAPLTATTNWLAAHDRILGATVPAGWLLDIAADDLEIHVTPDQAFVLVDRQPILFGDGIAHLRKGLHGLDGTHMSLIGEVKHVNDPLLHGTYGGTLVGTAARMDECIQIRYGLHHGSFV